MPHERKRHLSALVKHIAGVSPLVGVLGHRQVGKTTLLERLSDQYLSFDDEELLNEANRSPKEFLARLKKTGCALDECQLSERLFPALKERVRLDRRPGQFYLSGSVRFTSKKLIRESLTGRIISLDLLPMTLSELDEADLPEYLGMIHDARRLESVFSGVLSRSEYLRRMKLIELYKTQGGLPGACFMRDDRLRAQKLQSQLETILDRDLRQIVQTSLLLPDLLRFVRALSLRDCESIQHQELRRETGISPQTQKKLLYALESVFVLRALAIEGDQKGHAFFFEDQAESWMLSQGRLTPAQRWVGLIYRNLREQVMYQLGSNAEFFQFRTRGGSRVPFAIRSEKGILGVIPETGPLKRKTLASAHSFLRKYGNAKILIVTDQNETREVDERIWFVSAAQLVFN